MRTLKTHRCLAVLLMLALMLALLPSALAADSMEIADIENPCAAMYTVSEYPDEAVLKSEFPETIRVILTNGESVDVPAEWYCEDDYAEGIEPFYIFWASWDEAAYPMADSFDYQKMPYIEVDLESDKDSAGTAGSNESDCSGTAAGYTTAAENPVLSAGVQNILKRAYQQVNIAWTPLARVNGYSLSGNVYDSGVTYYGLPYGMIVNAGEYVPQTASFDAFLTAVNTPGSLFYTSRGAYNGRTSTYYATDCSTFASYSYGITRMTTYGFASSPYFETIPEIEDAQPGDCLNNTKLHIILITNLVRDADGNIVYYELSEETPPIARTILRTKAYVEDLVTNGGYVLKRYTNASDVAAPEPYAGYADPILLNGSEVSLQYDSADYDGETKEPEVTVTLNGETLQQGTDFTVTYQDNVTPGQALVKVSGTGAYGGYAYALFDIINSCPFEDVGIEEYYYAPVIWAAKQRVAAGITETQFCPDWSCTRAQMVTFLYRAAGKPEPEITEMPFTDVDENAYYYNAVLWAYENNITKGMTETTFGPELNVTRAQVVCFLYRFANNGERNEADAGMTTPFQDVPENAYYYNAVRWAYANSVTAGISETQFGPDADCTRGQIITLLYRYEKNS